MRDNPTISTVWLMFLTLFLIQNVLAFASSRSQGRLLQTIDTHQLLAASPSQQGGADGGETGKHLQKQAVVGIVVATLALGSILLCLLLYRLMQKPAANPLVEAKKAHPKSNPTEDQQSWSRAFSSLRLVIRRASRSDTSANALEYALLKAATNNFSTNNLLGRGGSGCIYKARFDENLFAAVKLLKNYPAVGPRVQHGFQREIELMSKIRHPNLVALLGYSIQNEQHNNHLLVYELMLNGSLEDQLHGPSQGAGLNWDLRMKIALDAARGLEHLHERCNPPIIHRDFKSSNILIDASFNAKVSDFGLAIPTSDISDDKSLELQGTFGYVAPEYLLDGILSEKSDVYAFGVVLLELISGRKPIDESMPVGSQSLVTWASPMLKERAKLMDMLDLKLEKEPLDLKHLHQVAAIAALCIQSEPSYRPLMKDVVSSLMPLLPIELGGARRSATEAERTMTMMVMRKGSLSPGSMQDDVAAKSLSFSEYSSKPELDSPLSYFSESARM
ncbi:hypothetical protein GOP47_0001453 [Adiantum capillus-veneris]|uniref:Protein kinase domain-containing protein n=1 Tax=Adiantum capillus-veneris TaxID=13818 RepID=A0A9D4UU24_ADICA|nr:hypothetical protein GOP47_0010037 [Adiantum capillus-veneris]KAI5081710.1 hypothetical protein GOP47_0001453 [Adiantum capillus-veneris]